jgi:hypothetical protein
MKNFSGVCQAAGADKPLRAFFIWITNIVTLHDGYEKNNGFPFHGALFGRPLCPGQ